tara:strand:- start:1137 stop:1445 length:309 start_codon:yes stop_codon:yes gene_type:complete
MALFIYGTANNTGKGFFTAEDRRAFSLRGYQGHDGSAYVDVWCIGNNERGAYWLAEKNGTEKTKAEAQSLVNAAVTLAQTHYDDQDDAYKARHDKPGAITLP